ncbi:hypothetical protein B0J13DRAFT_9718, partial [Dactylonectria estremocensis]
AVSSPKLPNLPPLPLTTLLFTSSFPITISVSHPLLVLPRFPFLLPPFRPSPSPSPFSSPSPQPLIAHAPCPWLQPICRAPFSTTSLSSLASLSPKHHKTPRHPPDSCSFILHLLVSLALHIFVISNVLPRCICISVAPRRCTVQIFRDKVQQWELCSPTRSRPSSRRTRNIFSSISSSLARDAADPSMFCHI